MSEPFIGQVTIFAGNFAPRGWAICDGRLVSIAQNSALFAILGTTYGGDGQVTFALPDLRGRAPIGVGNGPGLTPRDLGEAAGTESVTLTVPQMPAHTHTLVVSTTAPGGAARALEGELTPNPITTAEGMGVSGGSQPHENMQPYLALNYIIALQGIFPSRN